MGGPSPSRGALSFTGGPSPSRGALHHGRPSPSRGGSLHTGASLHHHSISPRPAAHGPQTGLRSELRGFSRLCQGRTGVGKAQPRGRLKSPCTDVLSYLLFTLLPPRQWQCWVGTLGLEQSGSRLSPWAGRQLQGHTGFVEVILSWGCRGAGLSWKEPSRPNWATQRASYKKKGDAVTSACSPVVPLRREDGLSGQSKARLQPSCAPEQRDDEG